MSKVATNLVSTIIERDKVTVKNGGKSHINQNGNAETDDDVIKQTNEIANYWVSKLTLLPHPFMEETYFKETFIDPQIVQVKKNEEEENNNRGADEMTRLTRSASSVIYYLHLPVDSLGDSTLFYRSRCSSISMHFYKGLPITLYYFAEDQKSKSSNNESSNSGDSKPKKYRQLSLRKVTLGPDGPEKGHMFHATITKNTWYARILDRKTIDKRSSNDIKNDDHMESSNFSLIGVSIAPGFDYNDLRTAPYGCLIDL